MFFHRNTTISALIASGRLRKIKQLIDESNVFSPDEQGHPPLYYAIKHQQVNIARYLLDTGKKTQAASNIDGMMDEVISSLCLPLIDVFLQQGGLLPDYINGLPLLYALIRHDKVRKQHIAFFIAHGIDINRIDNLVTGKTLLAYYLSLQDIRVDTLKVRALIELGADVNKADNVKDTPLYTAISNTTLRDRQETLRTTTFSSVLRELQRSDLQINLDIQSANMVEGQALKVLRYERYNGFIELLQAGMNLDEADKPAMVPYLTGENFNNRMTRALFAIDQQRQLGLPLSILLHDIRTIQKIVSELAPDSPGINPIFAELVTATHFPFNKKAELLESLLNKGADINATQPWEGKNISPLQAIAYWHNKIAQSTELARWLLDHGAAIEYNGYSAMHIALWEKNMVLVRLFAERGADLAWTDSNQGTLFTYLFTPTPSGEARSGNDIAANLHQLHHIYLMRGRSLPLNEPFWYNTDSADNFDQHYILPCAAGLLRSRHYIPITTALLEIGWPLNTGIKGKYVNGNIIAFYLHCAWRDEDISPLLDNLPEPLDMESEESGYPLYKAIISAVSLETIKRLLPRVTDINRLILRRINDEMTVKIHMSYLNCALSMMTIPRDDPDRESYIYALCQLLLEYGADPNTVSSAELTPEYGNGPGRFRREQTALEWAADQDYFTVFKLLLDHGADPRKRVCDWKEQFVHYATCRQSDKTGEQIINYLEELDRRGLLDLETRNHIQATPLLLAASKSQTTLVQYLLNKGADPNTCGGFDNSASLHRAISNWDWVKEKDRIETVTCLLAGGADINQIDPDGDTPLMCAVHYRCPGVLKTLLAHGAHPNVSNEKGATALHEVAFRQYPNTDTRTTDTDDDNIENLSNDELKIWMVDQLLERGANINAAREDGNTPLILALYADQFRVFRKLLKCGASVNQPDNHGRTPLMLALQYSHSRYANILGLYPEIKEGFHQVADNGNNLLHAICLRDDHPSAWHYFQAFSGRFNVEYRTNHAGATPLHYAAFHGHDEIVTWCCEQGMDINIADNNGDTPLHLALYAAENRYPDEYEEDEEYEEEDEEYEESVSDNITNIVTRLMTAGADPWLVNNKGESALALATRYQLDNCLQLMNSAPASTEYGLN